MSRKYGHLTLLAPIELSLRTRLRARMERSRARVRLHLGAAFGECLKRRAEGLCIVIADRKPADRYRRLHCECGVVWVARNKSSIGQNEVTRSQEYARREDLTVRKLRAMGRNRKHRCDVPE
jgi:hypothetical protein